jgi:hypothetical protein
LEPLVKLINHLETVYKSKGVHFYILYCKSIRGNLMNYLSGNPERDSLSVCTKDGIPKCLGDLIPLVRRESYLAIAMIHTILFSTRSLKTGKKPDLSTITQPNKVGDVPNLDKHMASF